MANIVKKIVITGGPGGGKHYAIPEIIQFCEDRGWAVIVMPSYISAIIDSMMPEDDFLMKSIIQEDIIRIQKHYEDICATAAAKKAGTILVIIPHGLMDSKAYLNDNTIFNGMIKKVFGEGIAEDQILSRYDAVYQLSTECKKHTDIDDCTALLDDRISEAWKNHPHYYNIAECADHNKKKKNQRLLASIGTFLDINAPTTTSKQFVVEITDHELARQEANFTASTTMAFLEDRSDHKRVLKNTVSNLDAYACMIHYDKNTGEEVYRRSLSSDAYREYRMYIEAGTHDINAICYTYWIGAMKLQLEVFNFDEEKGVLTVSLPEGSSISDEELFKLVKGYGLKKIKAFTAGYHDLAVNMFLK